jgi:hypothetical protein
MWVNTSARFQILSPVEVAPNACEERQLARGGADSRADIALQIERT